MNNLKFSSEDLKKIVSIISEKIMYSHIANITLINSQDLFISFSSYRKEKLLISLNPSHPFICLIPINNPCGTKVGALSDILRKEVKDGLVVALETINSDRVVSLTYKHTNEHYDKEIRKLIFELIPHRPNLILLGEDDTIIAATHYTDLSSPHKIIKGFKYEPLENKNTIMESDFNYDSFVKEAEEYYSVAVNKRLEERYKPVYNHIKSRIKNLNHKIDILNKDIETAHKYLNYKDHGTMLLTFLNDEEELNNYLKENEIDCYDPNLSISKNAEKCFTKYKKAKRTIEMGQIEIDKTLDTIDNLKLSLAQTKFMSEEDIEELANLLFPHKFKLNNKKKIEAKPGEITVNNIKISYGKNAKQNDYLTFKKANKTDWFFHVKDKHGSHVIIHHPSPDNLTQLVASEIALILSDLDCGEVQYTQIKNVKKGSFLGQAILTSYNTYNINKIRPETKKLL
ncbi:MAG: NFACT family protein [Bacilli bacterium]|nr:NFACT family protein [Bacilli bacterium]